MAHRTSIQAPARERKVERETGLTKASPRLPARRKRTAPYAGSRISPEERRQLIAEAAYFIAERRGFTAGSELEDWLQAESEINLRLGQAG